MIKQWAVCGACGEIYNHELRDELDNTLNLALFLAQRPLHGNGEGIRILKPYWQDLLGCSCHIGKNGGYVCYRFVGRETALHLAVTVLEKTIILWLDRQWCWECLCVWFRVEVFACLSRFSNPICRRALART